MKFMRRALLLALCLGLGSQVIAKPRLGPRTQEESDPNNPNWPPGDGFAGGKAPEKSNKTLKPGHVMDRFGHEGGRFTAPLNTSLEARAMKPGAEKLDYHRYKVLKDIEVKSGRAAPWFNQPGGGKQYALPMSVAELKNGSDPFIKELKVKPSSHPTAQAAARAKIKSEAKPKPKQKVKPKAKPKPKHKKRR